MLIAALMSSSRIRTILRIVAVLTPKPETLNPQNRTGIQTSRKCCSCVVLATMVEHLGGKCCFCIVATTTIITVFISMIITSTITINTIITTIIAVIVSAVSPCCNQRMQIVFWL